MLRRWVSACQSHGHAGLARKRKTYGAEFKLRALQHMWRHVLSYRQVCAVFDLRQPDHSLAILLKVANLARGTFYYQLIMS